MISLGDLSSKTTSSSSPPPQPPLATTANNNNNIIPQQLPERKTHQQHRRRMARLVRYRTQYSSEDEHCEDLNEEMKLFDETMSSPLSSSLSLSLSSSSSSAISSSCDENINILDQSPNQILNENFMVNSKNINDDGGVVNRNFVKIFKTTTKSSAAPFSPSKNPTTGFVASDSELPSIMEKPKPLSVIRRKISASRRTRSLNAPSPVCQFGPCGSIMKNPAMVMTIQDPASQRLIWHKTPASVLVIKKIHDSLIIKPFLDLIQWLIWEKDMTVFVENSVMDDIHLKNNPLFLPIKDKVRTFRDGKEDLTDKVDFIVCLGGDGTLLYASSLFQESVPPVMAFHMGSLGFLTPFEFDDFQQQINNVLKGNAALMLRSRLCCNVIRDNDMFGNKGDNPKQQNHCHLVLNEMVVDRGPSPYLSNVDLYIDGKRITTVQGDGLIVSTPTGSTAYAVAAGASMIHPSVPAIMITPICPHSLSFRPIVVPAGVELKICVAPDSRNSAWVSFDGRNRQEIKVGDSVKVTTSIYPVPSICAEDQITDWFDSLAECLHWNVRQRQKQFDEYSDLIHSSSSSVNSLDK